MTDERPMQQTRDEREQFAQTDPVMIAAVREIRAAGLKPDERSQVVDVLLQLRDRTRDGAGVTAARLAITAADQADNPGVARVLRRVAPHLITGEKR